MYIYKISSGLFVIRLQYKCIKILFVRDAIMKLSLTFSLGLYGSTSGQNLQSSLIKFIQ